MQFHSFVQFVKKNPRGFLWALALCIIRMYIQRIIICFEANLFFNEIRNLNHVINNKIHFYFYKPTELQGVIILPRITLSSRLDAVTAGNRKLSIILRENAKTWILLSLYWSIIKKRCKIFSEKVDERL